MLDMEAIHAAAARLAAAASSPSRIIVFGSYGRGTASENSDLDLMVVEREIADKADEYLRLMDALDRAALDIGVDLLLYPLAEFERRSQVPGTILFEARMEGKVLHDAIH
jgi:predicted nucleotidyltransferase